jgi:hypothetical protein
MKKILFIAIFSILCTFPLLFPHSITAQSSDAGTDQSGAARIRPQGQQQDTARDYNDAGTRETQQYYSNDYSDAGTNGQSRSGSSGEGSDVSVDILSPEEMRSLINETIGVNVGGQAGDTLKFGTILSELYPFLMVFSGISLFVMLVWGGFEMLSNPLEQKAQDAGKQRIMWAAIGFVLMFVSFWLAQLIEIIFGINILKS